MEYNQLFNYIAKYIKLSETDKELLKIKLTYLQLVKKEYALQLNERVAGTFFVNKGVVCSYYIKENGNEQFLQFAIENWWISNYEGLMQSTPSILYIQAIEDSEILLLKKEDEEELFRNIPNLESYFRIMYQISYAKMILRIKYLFEYSREELYRNFFVGYSEFVERVPHYMLASFSGMTPEYLSKIREKMIS